MNERARRASRVFVTGTLFLFCLLSITSSLFAVQPQHPPTAGDDNYFVAAGGVLTIAAPGVLSNDNDPNGDRLHAVLSKTATRGTLTFRSDGSFTYVNFGLSNADDSFTYFAADASSMSREATVHIHVKGQAIAAPVITTAAVDQNVCAGTTATFAAAASGVPQPTLQWMVSADGGATFTPIPGATASPYSFVATSADDLHQYRAVFTNAAGSASTTATLRVMPQPSILNQPASTTACPGGIASFSVGTTSGASIQWQVSPDALTFANIAGATAATYSFTASSSDSGHQYRASVSNSCGTVNSAAATLTIGAVPAVPVIVSPPANLTSGDQTTASVAQPQAGVTYQWSIANGTILGSATGNSISFVAGSANTDGSPAAFALGVQAVSATGCASASATANALVYPRPVAPTITAPNSVCAGTGTASVSNVPPGIQVIWNITADGSTTTVAGNPITFTGAGGTVTLVAIETNAIGVSASSSPFSVTIDGATTPVIVGIPANLTAGDQATASVTQPQAGVTYQWSIANGTIVNNGGTSITFFAGTANPDGSPAPFTLTVRAVSGTGCVSGNATATSLIYPKPVPPVITAPTRVCASSTGNSASVNNVPAGMQIVWTVTSDTGTSTTLAGDPITFAAGASGTITFVAIETNAIGVSASSAPFAVTIVPALAVTTSPADQTVCDAASVTLSAASNDPSAAVQWQSSIDGVTFTNIVGATSATYTFSASIYAASQYRAVFTGACSSATTAVAALMVRVPLQPISIAAPDGITAGVPYPIMIVTMPQSLSYQWLVTGPATVGNADPYDMMTQLTGTAANPDGTPSLIGLTVIGTAPEGCQTTATKSIKVYPQPIAPTITTPATVCAGAASTASVTAQPGMWYQWTSDAPFTTSSDGTSISYTPPDSVTGVYISVRAINALGDSVSSQVLVQVAPLPPLTPLQDQTFCIGDTAAFTTSLPYGVVSGSQWQVSKDGGATFADIPGTANLLWYSFTTAAEDNGNIYRVVLTNGCGSRVTGQSRITVDGLTSVPAPVIPQVLTEGLTYTATVPAQAGFTYSWNVSTGTVLSGNGTNSITFRPDPFGFRQLWVRVVAISARGCVSPNAGVATAVVYPPPAIQVPTVAGFVCANSTGNAATVSATGADQIVWTITTDGVTTTAAGQSITFSAGSAGSVDITATAVNGAGDTASASVSVPIVALPSSLTVTSPVNGTTVTAGAPVTLAASSSDPSVMLNWQVSADGGANYTTIGSPVSGPTWSYTVDTTGMSGTFSYRVEFASPCGAVVSKPIVLTITPAGG